MKERLLFANQYAWPDAAATAQLMSDVVEKASAQGVQCRVVASDRGYSDRSVRYPRDETRGLARYQRAPSTAFGREGVIGRVTDYMTFLAGAAWLLLRGVRPDLIVGMSTPPILGALAVAAAGIRGARSAYWAMDVYPDLAFELGAMRPYSVPGRAFAALSRWTLRSADVVIALGETMAGRLRALGARNVVTVHNWADGEAIRPIHPEESEYRRVRGWGGKFVVLYSGNLGLAHEFETVLGAAELLREEEEVLFAFVGDGPRRAEVESEGRSRGLRNLEFHPPVPREKLGDALAAGDAHLVTLRPRMPGLLVPSKIYGILAAGRPSLYVGPKEGEVFDIVTRGDCGLCVENGDAEGLAEAVRRLRRDCASEDGMGRRARDLFDREFTMEGQTKKLLAALTDLMVDKRAAGN
jgi:glycosyltransferase involved in cell wall biosynthesis